MRVLRQTKHKQMFFLALGEKNCLWKGRLSGNAHSGTTALWSWSFRHSCKHKWVLGIKRMSSTWVVLALNHWTTSPAPLCLFCCLVDRGIVCAKVSSTIMLRSEPLRPRLLKLGDSVFLVCWSFVRCWEREIIQILGSSAPCPSCFGLLPLEIPSGRSCRILWAV